MTTSNDLPHACFRLSRAAEDLLVEKWGDMHAVYQRASGETHAFNAATMALIDCLRQGALSFDMILGCVAIRFAVSADALSLDDFVQVLLRLEELGLIERAVAP